MIEKIQSNRSAAISFLQFFGIFIVVLEHSDIQDNGFWWLTAWIPTFSMPMFMLISGYLFMYTGASSKKDVIPFILGKVKRLLVPYIIISGIVFFPKVYLSQFAIREIDGNLESFIRMLIFPMENTIRPFWFLPTIFIMLIAAMPLIKYFGNKIIYLLIALSAIKIISDIEFTQFLCINRACDYMFYWGLGCAYSIWEKKIKLTSRAGHFTVLTIALSISILLQIYTLNGEWMQIVRALAGITFAVSLAYAVSDTRIGTLMTAASTYTFTIFLYHWFPQVALRTAGNIFGINALIISALMLTCGLLFPVLLIKSIRRSPLARYEYSGILLGGKMK